MPVHHGSDELEVIYGPTIVHVSLYTADVSGEKNMALCYHAVS
jgi:hypothetical protein